MELIASATPYENSSRYNRDDSQRNASSQTALESSTRSWTCRSSAVSVLVGSGGQETLDENVSAGGAVGIDAEGVVVEVLLVVGEVEEL
jgi:hypothetical protein